MGFKKIEGGTHDALRPRINSFLAVTRQRCRRVRGASSSCYVTKEGVYHKPRDLQIIFQEKFIMENVKMSFVRDTVPDNSFVIIVIGV